jgi:15-cis-phytoene synthase
MKSLFDELSASCSQLTTNKYSTSFSLGIRFLGKEIQNDIHSIYGFVRFADEIVDSFDGFDQEYLMSQFEYDLQNALEHKISLNPILNSFQKTVYQYKIDRELINKFLLSMKMDLDKKIHNRETYDDYIFGSAEVVGLMCLKVFVNGDDDTYKKLTPAAQKLGSAFQKVNFLRDLKDDYETLGRTYFPNVDISEFGNSEKIKIEKEIEEDFRLALLGIKELPIVAKSGVYLAYVYYLNLFNKIKRVPAHKILTERIRIPNIKKVGLMAHSLLRYQMNLL